MEYKAAAALLGQWKEAGYMGLRRRDGLGWRSTWERSEALAEKVRLGEPSREHTQGRKNRRLRLHAP